MSEHIKILEENVSALMKSLCGTCLLDNISRLNDILGAINKLKAGE